MSESPGGAGGEAGSDPERSQMVTGTVDVLNQLIEIGDEACRIGASQALARLDEPLRVAMAGRVKAGKSTLLNALMGEQIAATDAAECTRFVTWYRKDRDYQASAVLTDGSRRVLRLDRGDGSASIDMGTTTDAEVERLEVGVPSSHLDEIVLIDTPGIDSITEHVSDRSATFLAPGSGDQGADVLVFLMRYLHSEDSEFLEAFTDPSARTVDPVRSVAVLSRADELGSGRGDGLVAAAEVAHRYQRHHHLRQLVSEVLPISGLLALFAATFRQRDFDVVEEIASLSGEDVDRLFASPWRFTAETKHLRSTAETRRRLLLRLGLPGARLSVVAIQAGRVRSPDELGAFLGEMSGIEPLRRLLLERFAGRSDALKAARALDHAERLVATLSGRASRTMQRQIDRVRTNSHDLRELDAIRAVIDMEQGDVAGIETSALLRFLGNDGVSAGARLGEAGSSEAMQAEAVRQVSRLNGALSSGFIPRAQRRVVEDAVRSLEALHYRLGRSMMQD